MSSPVRVPGSCDEQRPEPLVKRGPDVVDGGVRGGGGHGLGQPDQRMWGDWTRRLTLLGSEGRAAGQLACNAALSATPAPVRASTSTAPVTELRRNSIPFCPASVRAATTSPSGSTTFVPAVR